ncbi:MAG: F-box protein, partial [Burkholderiales bacterium]
MNPKIMYITNNNLYTILKNNNILDRNDKHSAEERIKSVLRVAFEEDGHSPDAFEQLKNAAKLAIEVVQDNINHGGGTKQILTEHIAEKLGGNPKAIELFDKLIRNNRFDLEITSAHRWHLLGNRKLSFFSISYTNTNQSLLNFIDKLDNFSKVDFLSFLPHEVNLNILKYLPASDQKTFRLVNSIATSLVDDKHNSSNPLATVKLNRSITATKSKFDRFLKYLASSHCKITSLDLSQIRATHKSFRGFSLEKLIISLNKNTSIISLNITGCDLYDEDLELIGGIPKLKKVIMTNGMDDDTKIKILSANDSWGNPKLYLALRIGNIGLVIALTKAILSSKLPQEVKSKLLA